MKEIIDPSQMAIPQEIRGTLHRVLEGEDIEIIFRDPGPWWLFYALQLYSGLRCDDIATLVHGNFDLEHRIIIKVERRYKRCRQIPLVLNLLGEIPLEMAPNEPLFPELFFDCDDDYIFEEEMGERLMEPLKYMQALLGAEGRPIASLHSFTLTHESLIQDYDLFAEDQLWILTHIANVIIRARRPLVLN